MAATGYLLAGQLSELERLQLQSRVWEPSGRALLVHLGAGQGLRALDVGCGCLGWLRVLSQWVGSQGTVTGTDVDDRPLDAARTLIAQERLTNVTLLKGDLFESRLAAGKYDLVHARFEIGPLGRADEQLASYLRLRCVGRMGHFGGSRPRFVAFQSPGTGGRASHSALAGRVSRGRGRSECGPAPGRGDAVLGARAGGAGRSPGAAAGTPLPPPSRPVQRIARAKTPTAGVSRRAGGASPAGRGGDCSAGPLGHDVHPGPDVGKGVP